MTCQLSKPLSERRDLVGGGGGLWWCKMSNRPFTIQFFSFFLSLNPFF